MRVRVWAILGDANAGKSTMITHLASIFGKGETNKREGGSSAGRGDGDHTLLLRGGGYLKIWKRKMALQEARLLPAEFVAFIEKRAKATAETKPKISPEYYNVLIALRHTAHLSFPAGHEYLSHFASVGWKLESLVTAPPTTNFDLYLKFGVPVCRLIEKSDGEDTKANRVPIGWRAGQIRNHFGWA
jgi:hypothetical protein